MSHRRIFETLIKDHRRFGSLCFKNEYIKNCQTRLYLDKYNVLLQQRNHLSISSSLYAGHSKWQNIKHTKASKDSQKSQLYSRLISKIKPAVSKQGGIDPKLNKEFADVIDMCRKANMPNATIDRAIKRALEKKCFTLKMEIIGPEGSLLIIDAEVENRNLFRNQIRNILKKYIGFGFANEGRALSMFAEKGVVRVKNKQGDSNLEMEKAEEIAIEADAEEVQICEQDDTILMFIGDELSHTKVKNYIEKNHSDNYVVTEFGVELIPHVRAELPEETLQQVVNAIEELEELEGIIRIYNNI